MEFKAIGDQYVKDEFRRHKNCKPEEITPFMTGWLVCSIHLMYKYFKMLS